MRIRISSRELELLGDFIRQQSGIHLDARKTYLFEYRLAPLLEELGLTDFESLYNRVVEERGDLLDKLISAITTDETSFFRDAEFYTCLADHLLPELIAHKRRLGLAKPRLTIWSAACSRGQEPYSLAMILREMALSDVEVRILATDISARAIAYAVRGTYTKYELSRGLSLTRLRDHFVMTDRVWRVHDELRAMVSFEKMNLLTQDPVTSPFDLILCRNVAVYFTPEDRDRLFARVRRHMNAHGKLIVGATETLFARDHFTLVNHGSAQYYRAGNPHREVS